MHARVYAYTYACLCACSRACMHTFQYVLMYIYIYICIWYTHTFKESSIFSGEAFIEQFFKSFWAPLNIRLSSRELRDVVSDCCCWCVRFSWCSWCCFLSIVFFVFFLMCFWLGFSLLRKFRKTIFRKVTQPSDASEKFGNFRKQPLIVEVLLGKASFPNQSESNSCYGLHITTLNRPLPDN